MTPEEKKQALKDNAKKAVKTLLLIIGGGLWFIIKLMSELAKQYAKK